MFKLIIEDDEGHTTIVPLVKDEITIGRKEGNTIRLTERNVSRHHARLIRSNGSFFIEDLDSYNGVKVNGNRITTRTTLREGDLLEIGDYHLALQKVAEKAEDEAPPLPAPQSAPAAEGATAILKLPVDQKPSAEKGRVRPIPNDVAFRLEVISTDLKGKKFVLNRTEMTLGREEGNDIVIPHRSVSSVHAKIVFDGGVYRILDLDSANGVLVNGEEYVRVDLRRGDVIELGHVKLRFLAPGDPSSVTDEQATRPDIPAYVPGAGKAKLLKKALFIGLPLSAALIVFILFRSGGEKKPEEAVGEPVVQHSETRPEASQGRELYQEGMSLFSQRRYTDAIAKFEALKQQQPGYTGLDTMLEKARQAEADEQALAEARAAIEQGDLDRAYEAYSRIVDWENFGDDVKRERDEAKKSAITRHLNLANIAMKSADTLAKAEAEIKRVLEIDPENARAKNLLAMVRKNRQPVAVVAPREPAAQKAVAPKVPADPWQATGVNMEEVRKALSSKTNLNWAITSLDKVLKVSPKDCNALYLMGSAHIYAQKKSTAIQYLKSFVNFCSKDPRVVPIRNALRNYEESP